MAVTFAGVGAIVVALLVILVVPLVIFEMSPLAHHRHRFPRFR